MKIRLVPVLKSPYDRTVSFHRTPFVIGRAADCDLQLDNPMVSRRHCEVTVMDGEVRVRDLGSSNGTFVNNEPVSDEQILAAGDHLCVAAAIYKVEIYTSGSGINLLLQLGRSVSEALT